MKSTKTDEANNKGKPKNCKLCCMPHCTSKTKDVVDGQKLSFHEIPCDSTMREIFLKFIDRKDEKGNPWIPNQKSIICSRHFEASCLKSSSNGVRRLLPGSIPTIFPDGHPKAKKFRITQHKKAAAQKEQDKIQAIKNQVETSASGKRNIAETQDAVTPSKKAKPGSSKPDDPTTDNNVILVSHGRVFEKLEVFSESEDECQENDTFEPAHCLEDLCRLCLEPCANNCVNVFAPRMPIRLGIMINFCLPIQVNKDDILPLNICIPCKEKVEEYYKFAVHCKSSEKRMMEMYQTQKFLQLSSEPVTAMESTSHSSHLTLSPSSVEPSATTEPLFTLPELILVTPMLDLSQIKLENIEASEIVESSAKNMEVSTYNCKYCHGIFYERQKCELHMRSSHRAQRKEERKKKKMLAREEKIRLKKSAKESKNKIRKIRKKHEGKEKKVRVPRVPPKPKKPRTPCQCDICDKIFCSKDSLRMHIRRHNSEKNIICHLCGLRFYYISELKQHNNHFHDRNPVWCDMCNTKFSRKQVLSEHMIAFHLERYRYICKECNDFYRTKREIKEHVKTHGENTDFIKYFLHRCEVCNIDCKTRYRKRLHFKRKHKNVRLNLKPNTSGHYCRLCFKLFRFGVNYQNHYKKQHPGIPVPTEPQPRNELKSSLLPYLYNCELCSKKFKFSDKFSKHMKKHNTANAGKVRRLENA